MKKLNFWRIILCCACLIAGYRGTAHSLAWFVSTGDAGQAVAIDDSDGRIIGKALEQAMAVSPESDEAGAISQQAKLALLKDSTAVEALIVLGLQAQLREEKTRSDEALSLARRLSLRELRSNIWRIEEAVALGDIDGALVEYDLALSTSRSSRDTLFPVLARALREPEISNRMVKIFSDKANWHPDFVEYVADSYADPAATVAFFRELDRAGLALDREMATFVDALVAGNNFAEAQQMHRVLRKIERRQLVSNQQFSPEVKFPTVLDWSVAATGGLSSALASDGGDSYLSFSISSGSYGILAQQLLTLPPGTYRVAGRASGIDPASADQVYWTFRCLNGRDVGEVPLRSTKDGPVEFAGTIALPSSCPAQNFALVAKSVRGQGSVSGRIHEVSITSLSQ